MSLIVLIIWPLAGGLLAWLAGRWNKTWPRWISLAVLILHLCALVAIGVQALGQVTPDSQEAWAIDFTWPWIPQWGVAIHLAMDGLSFLLLLLVDFLGIVAVAASWMGIQERVGFFHFNLLWILAALAGVFLALDLILFYFFWEMMLVPLYFLIGIWGHENRVYATLKFFIFTQASGLLMLLSILGLYSLHGQDTGTYTFDYLELLGTSIPPSTAMWLMLGFFAAFAVKLSAVPVHAWLPDAHTEAPTAGSVILAGLVLKAGAYGLLRFLVPLFPEVAVRFAPVAMVLGGAGIIYGAILAFAQTDLKRLVAYTSISHMGFVLVGIFAWNQLALQGAVIVMLAHGVTTGALFVLVGYLQERMHTRDLRRLGGLWSAVPAMGGVALFLAAASLGLPGLANFVGEFLVLLGAYLINRPLVVVAALGFILAAVYALWMIQRAFAGPNKEGWRFPDLTGRETIIMTVMIVVIVWLGLYPQPALKTASRALETMQRYAAQSQQTIAPMQDDVGGVP
jgi:NADH-quinone oxidoreductase subunit M